MAVNIDTVYQTVLAIANKEQRGYLTPQEFNLMASRAQREIFEQYFYDINRFSRMPGNSTEFSDMLYILEEKLAPFRVNDASLTASILYTDDFELDIAGWAINASTTGNGSIEHVAPAASNNYNGGLKIIQSANTIVQAEDQDVASLTAGKKYKLSWSIIDLSSTLPTNYQVSLQDGSSTQYVFGDYEPMVGNYEFTFAAETTSSNYRVGLKNGDTSDSNRYVTFGEVKLEEIDNATLANNVYRLGDVSWTKSGAAYPTIAPEVTANQIKKYNVSPLARPTSSNPTYVRTGETSIKLYPTPSSTDTVTYSYVKTPTDPYWGYVVVPKSQGGNEYPLYDSSTAVNFELHESEETTLVNKILELAGIIAKQPDLIQAGAGKDASEFQKENS